MATIAAVADGNWTDAATWALVDSTSELDSEVGNESVTSSYVDSAAFTPGAITVAGVMVKEYYRAGATGTISLQLRQGGVAVAGTTVTINVADLPFVWPSSLGGWHYFKFATPVTLAAATAYTLAVKGSGSGDVLLYRNATAGNWSRELVTTTQQAPAAGDKILIAGEYTGAGTGNTRTVTLDSTTNTDYGAIKICAKGILTLATAAATAYQLKTSGVMSIYPKGKLWLGTVATPLPADSTFDLLFDCTTAGEFGIEVHVAGSGGTNQGGELIIQGAPKTPFALLAANAAVAATTLTLDRTPTGWRAGDQIILGTAPAPTTTTTSSDQSESRVLNADVVAASAVITAGLTNYHHGTAAHFMQGEVANVTRNIKLHGASISLPSYLAVGIGTSNGGCTVDIDNCEFYWWGANVNGKRGIQIELVSMGSVDVRGIAYRDSTATSIYGFYIGQAVVVPVELHDSVFYNLTGSASTAVYLYASSSLPIPSVHVCDNVCVIKAYYCFNWATSRHTLTNCIASGGTSAQGFLITDQDRGPFGNIDNLVAHNCSGQGFSLQHVSGGKISNLLGWKNSSYGLNWVLWGRAIVDGFRFFANGTAGIIPQADMLGAPVIFRNGKIYSVITQGVGIMTYTAIGGHIFENVEIGYGAPTGTSVHGSSGDFWINARQMIDVIFRDCIFGSTVEVKMEVPTCIGSRVRIERKDSTAGSHQTLCPEGTISHDTVIADTDGHSERLKPAAQNAGYNLANQKLRSGRRLAVVANGGTITFSCKVRKSVIGDAGGAVYNGNQPRLILEANPALGIDADVVLATASNAANGAWETISGTTPAATDDGVLAAYVDVDGTAGWVNTDTWAVA